MAAGDDLNDVKHYLGAATEAWLKWNGENSADFILDFLRRTGESVSEVLEEAMAKHMKERH